MGGWVDVDVEGAVWYEWVVVVVTKQERYEVGEAHRRWEGSISE